jgi:hypothetical protein
MIRMTGNGAVRTESEHHVWTEPANMERQVTDHFVKILAVELAVGIIQNDSTRNFQDFASRSKLLSPQRPQFLVACSATAMGSGLPRSKADYAGFDATIVREAERPTKASGLVVGMGGDAHQAKHGLIVT